MIDRDKLNEHQLALLDAALIENGADTASKLYEYLTEIPPTKVCVIKYPATEHWSSIVVDDSMQDFVIETYDSPEKAIEMVEKLGLAFTWSKENGTH